MIVIYLGCFRGVLLLGIKIVHMRPNKTIRIFKKLPSPVLFALTMFFSGLLFAFTEESYFLFFMLSILALFCSLLHVGRKIIAQSK
jgi:hypothetical protein